MRPTDIKDCPRLHLPPARPEQEEIELITKECLWNQAYNRYRETKCNEKGIIQNDPMTKQERRGKAKLSKRARNGEIVISTTDKSCELTISSMDSYTQQGEVHIADGRM